MLDVDVLLRHSFLAVASNDNEDLLAPESPAKELSTIRMIKQLVYEENRKTGILLNDASERRFLDEILDAERYLVLRFFTSNVPKSTLNRLKRHILDRYLSPLMA
ncbi:MAG: hypothetical protein ACK5XN_07710 [Bacteroidota bacterium]